MPTDTRDPERHVLLRNEESILYCFDFSNESVVAAGGVISSPVVTITDGQTLVTLGTPAVLVADFTEIDENEETSDTVETGKGVSVAVTPRTTKGECTVTCQVTADNGSKPCRSVIFKVR